MEITRSLPVLVALAHLASASACPKRSSADLLWLPPGATIDVDAFSMRAARSVYKDGSAAVGFTIAAPNRLEEFTTRLTRHFEQVGWHPRRTQWLNPGLATSFNRGWNRSSCGILLDIGDAQGMLLTPLEAYQWTGEWEDKHGNVITYSLMASRYQFATYSDVRAYAQYVPAKVIESALKRLGKTRR